MLKDVILILLCLESKTPKTSEPPKGVKHMASYNVRGVI